MKSCPAEVSPRSKSEAKQLRELCADTESAWPLWARIVIWFPCFIGVVMIVTTLPLSTSHLKVVGGVFLWSVHTWMLLDSLVTGVFKSKQGNYERAEKPIRFWAMCLFLAAMQLAIGTAAISAWYGI